MTSATERLRALLDERGVEWTYGDGTVSYASDGHWCHAWAYNDNAMCVSMGYFTPAQAIDATLGRGTCHRNWRKDGYAFCSECGYNITGPWAHWCPNCGRKVEQ